MDINFNEDIVKYGLSYDAMVASRLLRKGRKTVILEDQIQIRNDALALEIEDVVIGKFLKTFRSEANADLDIKWDRYLRGSLQLSVKIIPTKDIEPGSIIKIGEIYF